MGLREDLYKDVQKLYQKRIARTHFLKEKSLEAIRDGRLDAGLNARTKDVIRWILEDREMRLRRKRDLAVLYSEWQEDKDERTAELNRLLDECVKEREQTRENWLRTQARYLQGKNRIDSLMVGRDYRRMPPPAQQERSEKQAEEIPQAEGNKSRGWQIGELE